MDNDCITFLLSVIVILLVVADVCESVIKAANILLSLSMVENSDCLYQTLSRIFPRHIHADFSEPTLVEPLAKFRRRKSVQQWVNRAVHWQDKNHYPSVQVS